MDDWKLNARTEVKLKNNVHMFVSFVSFLFFMMTLSNVIN